MPKLPWFAVSSVFLGFVHHITAIVFTIPTISAANYLVVNLNEFLFLQIDSPRINCGNGFYAPVSFGCAYNHICRGLRIKAAKLEILCNVRYFSQIADYSAVLDVTCWLYYRNDFTSG